MLAGADGVDPDSPATVVMLAACALVTEMRGTRLSSRLAATATGQIIVLAAVTTGPIGAAIVALAAQLGDPPPPLARWFTYTGLYATQGVAAGFAAQAVAPIGTNSASDIAGQAVCAAVAVFAVNFAGNAAVSWARGIANLRQHLRMVAMGAGGGCVFSAPVVAILGYGYVQAGLAVLLLALVPILAAVGLLGMYREKTELARRLSEGNMTFALALVRALDARDAYTAGHSAAVAVYARDLARAAGYSPDDVAKIQLAALLHDVGKIAVPLEILTKPQRLTEAEWAEIRRHPEIGEKITGEAPVFREVARLIRHHHERPDGTGYPGQAEGGADPGGGRHHRARRRVQRHDAAARLPQGRGEGDVAGAGDRGDRGLRRHAVRPAPRRAVRQLPADVVADLPAGGRPELLARRPAPRDHGRDRRRGRRDRRRRRNLAVAADP